MFNMTIVNATSAMTSEQRTEQLTEEEIDFLRKCIDEFTENQKKKQEEENEVEIDSDPMEDTAVVKEKDVSIKEKSGKSVDPQTEDVHGEPTEKVNIKDKGIVDGEKCLQAQGN